MKTGKRAALLAAFALAACSGPATSSLPVPAVPNAAGPLASADDSRAPKAEVKLVFFVPPATRARFVSPATQGAKLRLSGTRKIERSFGLTATSKGCKSSAAGTSCIITFRVPAGTYDAAISTWNEAPVNGRIPPGAELLATANVAAKIRAGKTHHLKFRLDGAPASIVLNAPAGTAGSAFNSPQPIGIDVEDAGGYTIVGSYESPVKLADADTSGATAIATSGSDAPPAQTLTSSSDFATLSYTGLAIAPATISASSASGARGSATFAPALQPIVVTTNDTMNPSFVGVDLDEYGHGSPTGTLTLSEIGWSEAPYDRAFSAVPQAACASIATVSPSNGIVFTVTAAANPIGASCTLVFSDGTGRSINAMLAFTGYYTAGTAYAVTLPAGVTTLSAGVWGAQGGSAGAQTGGYGGYIEGTMGVTPGDVVTAYVGNMGASNGQATVGFDGGGISAVGGGGGDASDIRIGGTTLADRVLVAGGGGGAGTCGGSGTNGGGDGGLTPTEGGGGTLGGGAATTSLGGSAGIDGGSAGGLGLGGTGGGCGGGGGGGGGGLYGGGGGGATGIGPAGGGGGGGMSYAAPGIAVTYSSNVGTQTRSGDAFLKW